MLELTLCSLVLLLETSAFRGLTALEEDAIKPSSHRRTLWTSSRLSRRMLEEEAIDRVTEVILYTKLAEPFSQPASNSASKGEEVSPCTYPSNFTDIQSAQPLDSTPWQIKSMPKCVDGWTGLTFELLRQMLGKVHPDWSWKVAKDLVSHKMVSVVPLPGNAEIFEFIRSPHCNASLYPSRLCIGAAAISITPVREETMDFLPSYFQAGLQVMARHEDSVWDRVWGTLELICQLLGWIIALVVSLILVIAPIAWFLETSLSGDKVSCFHVSDAELMGSGAWRKQNKDGSKGEENELSSKKRMRWGMWQAFQWTAIVFIGGDVGRPASKPVVGIKAAGKALSKIILVSIVAGMTTVIARGTEITAITDIGAIKPGESVCVNGKTTASNYLEVKQPDYGYTIEAAENIASMLVDFWTIPEDGSDAKCDAVIYDFPILSHALKKQKTKCKDASGDCNAAAGLVGKVLTKDPYGLVSA